MGVGLTNSVNLKCLTSNKQNIVEGMAPELGHKKDSFRLASPPSLSQVSSSDKPAICHRDNKQTCRECMWRGMCMRARSLQLFNTLQPYGL